MFRSCRISGWWLITEYMCVIVKPNWDDDPNFSFFRSVETSNQVLIGVFPCFKHPRYQKIGYHPETIVKMLVDWFVCVVYHPPTSLESVSDVGGRIIVGYMIYIDIWFWPAEIGISYDLVGGLEHVLFSITWNNNTPIWPSYLFRGVGIPPSRYEYIITMVYDGLWGIKHMIDVDWWLVDWFST